MKTNVSTLLREFPKIRRAALAGDEVIVVTREGNLKITAESAQNTSILGISQGDVVFLDDDLDKPTTSQNEWEQNL